MIVDFVIKVILAVITVAIDIIAWLWDHGLNHVIGILRGAWDIIFGVVKGAIEIIVSVISFFLDLITGRWSKLGEDLKGIWHGIWDAIQGIVKGAGEILVNAVAGLAGLLWQAGRDVVQGLWQGFLSIKDWFTHQFERLLKDIIPSPLRSLFGLSSPSKLMAEYGRNIMQGLAGGIAGSAGLVQGAMNSAMPSLPGIGGLGMGGRVVYVAPGAFDFSGASITQEALPGIQTALSQFVQQLAQEVNSR
jgi:phage-related protein